MLRRVWRPVSEAAEQQVAVDSRFMVCALCAHYFIRLQLNLKRSGRRKTTDGWRASARMRAWGRAVANAEARLDQLRGARRRGELSVGGLRVELGGRATTFKTTIPNTRSTRPARVVSSTPAGKRGC